jgi:hypothetical protein
MRRKIHIPQNCPGMSKESRCHNYPRRVEPIGREDPNAEIIKKSGFVDLPVVIRDDPQFRDSLALSARVRRGELPFTQMSSRLYTFTSFNGKNSVTIGAVMAMLSFSEDFKYDAGRHCGNGSQFTFVAY